MADGHAQPAGDSDRAMPARLAAVPLPDEPELPIPTPAAQHLPVTPVGLPSPFDGTPAPAAPEAAASDVAQMPACADPLAAIMALSEAERIALFT
jgi:hypothetical protein